MRKYSKEARDILLNKVDAARREVARAKRDYEEEGDAIDEIDDRLIDAREEAEAAREALEAAERRVRDIGAEYAAESATLENKRNELNEAIEAYESEIDALRDYLLVTED